MYDAILANLNAKAEEFGTIARQVNEASRLRKIHSEEAIALIRQSMEVGDILSHEFEIISRANRGMRDRDTTVQSYCSGLEANLRRQKELLQALLQGRYADPSVLERLGEMTDALAAALQKAILLLHLVIQNDTEIVLLDGLIISRKKFQRESLARLRKLAFRTNEDADAAIRGSSSNLRRGMQMVERLKGVKRLIDDRHADQLEGLIEEANAGWNTAASVNRSSITQMVFTGEVNRFTEKLHADSIAIQDLVTAKHRLFTHNLELIGDLTVILSLEIKDFLPARDIVEEIVPDLDLPDDVRNMINNLISYVHIACRDIDAAAGMNFDMKGALALDSDMEKKAVELTKIKIGYFDRIREVVRSMTEATSYPIEGSGRNIENGKILELYLRQILERVAGAEEPGAARS